MDHTTDQSSGITHSNTTSKQAVADDIFSALANQRRRYTLHCLHQYDVPLPLADLADEIAVYENDTDITNIQAEQVKRIYMSLYHTHIPKLANSGLVTYNQERDMVALAENITDSSALAMMVDTTI